MNKFKLDCPFIITPLKQHLEIKDKLLDAINRQESDHLAEEQDDMDISRCDWRLGRWDYEREWFKILRDPLVATLDEVTKELGYAYFKIMEIWFQQYQQASHHGWHVHGHNWTNVYFLELPKDSPRTQYINPFNQNDIHTFDVQEGDILTFPSFVIHRAPANQSSDRKTIVSWNMDTELQPGLYSA